MFLMDLDAFPAMDGKQCAGAPCDMRGFLSFFTLWLLNQKPRSGKDIAEEIGKKKGECPKSGTIYPALKNLKEHGLIQGKRDGKEIVYSLTADGKRAYENAFNFFVKAYGEIVQGHEAARKKN